MPPPRILCGAALIAVVVAPLAAGDQRPLLPPADTGDFVVEYHELTDPDYAELQRSLQQDRVLESLAADLNDTLRLPTDIALTFAECGAVNAFYDPEARRIAMCFELVERLAELFAEDADTPDAAEDALIGATIFVLFHELGHALVHVLDLPITGREEDAVDQLATLILADGTDEGEQAALDGARWFYLEDEQAEPGVEDLAFWDEHSLNQQRFYNVVCWIYGHAPASYQDLVTEGFLPEERAVRCEEEFGQLARSWERLLEPYLKP